MRMDITPHMLQKEYFSQHRFCLMTMRTRFGTYDHFVTDAETITDEMVKSGECPATVLQTSSYTVALDFCSANEKSKTTMRTGITPRVHPNYKRD